MQIIKDRRALHRIPELEKDLPKTIAYLTAALSELKCQIFSPAEGSLCAWFDFGREAAIAFRADADALPIQEKNVTAYTSQHPGRMHACGHDGHMAMLLELARRLDQKASLPHNVLLVFQAGEESPGGAREICESGVFSRYQVRAIFGMHLWPGLAAGEIFSRKEELMPQASEVTMDIYGKSSHIAKAGEGIDALAAGAEFYRRATALEQALPAGIHRLLKFGKFHSGTVRNALSAHTHIEGSLRAFQTEVFEGLRNGLMAEARAVEEGFGCSVQLHFADGYPAVLNPEALYEKVRTLVPLRELEAPFMTAEDFSWYQRYLPGVFFFLGLGDTPALHADTFDFDESLLVKGAELFETLAERF